MNTLQLVGTVAARHAPGAERKYTIRNGALDNLQDGVYHLFASTDPNAVLGEREKIAPVQGYMPGIPWSLHLEAYDAYRAKWGAQPALIEGGCRGGFHVGELDAFVPGWRDRVSEIVRLRTELEAAQLAVAAWKWGYRYLQTRMESIDRHGWAHDCDNEIAFRLGAK